MRIDTYFGFFAEAVLTAVGTSLTQLTTVPVNLEAVEISTTNTIKLRFSEVETVLLPELAAKVEVNFVFALTEADVATLTRLSGDRMPFHKLLEQVISTAAEPFNFVTKRRNRLTALTISRNVTGFTAHHLDGEVSYTMATGQFSLPKGHGFAMRLLVTARGRDMIEERAEQKSTQRALFSIREGAYLCRPQWEPPPPPPGMERGAGLSEGMRNAWLQTFLGANGGKVANRLFGRPVGLLTESVEAEAFAALAVQSGPPTVARLQLNGEKALELFVLLPGDSAKSLIQLSRSGQEKFLGDLFRVLYGESAERWGAFAGTPMTWKLLAARQIPTDALDAVTTRLEGGGLMLSQRAHMDDGHLAWLVAMPPHTWHWLMRVTARAMGRPTDGLPNRQVIFESTGWGQNQVPWKALLPVFNDRDLRELMHVLDSAKATTAHLAAVAELLDPGLRERWREAMAVRQRELVVRIDRHRLPAIPGAPCQSIVSTHA